jgi:hypothetical protein
MKWFRNNRSGIRRRLAPALLLALASVPLMPGTTRGEGSTPVYNFQFASAGSGAGQLNTPLAMATDPNGNVGRRSHEQPHRPVQPGRCLHRGGRL